ncbi:MAG: RIP metalloprotease RseP [Brevinematia bacterium]
MITIASIAIGILFLGLIVLVHEFGHFLVAKWRKIDVEIFSIGFGPKIWSKNINGVDFRISIIPFGGYVKMKGDNPNDINPEDKNTFYGTNPMNRILTAFAGPFFNYLFALIIVTIIFIVGFKTVGLVPRIYIETSKGINYFSIAGMKSGDLIKKIDDKEIKSFQQIDSILIYKMDQNVEITFERDGKIQSTTVYIPKNYINNEGGLGISVALKPIIGSVINGSPAEQAGLKEKDVILKVNDRDISFFNEASEIIRKSDKEVKLTILRDNKELIVKIKPKFDEKNKIYYIGITPYIPEEYVVVTEKKITNPILGFIESFNFVNEKLIQIIKSMQLLFSGKIDFQSSIAGPIRITYFLSNAIENQVAIQNLLIIVAVISMAIGIFNLIPFPGLDGWHIVISSFEIITKKKPSPTVIGVIETVGFIAIVLLTIFVLFNDIFNLLVRDLKIFR